MNKLISWLVTFFLFLFASLAAAGTRDPNTPDAQYLEFGKKFPFVVRICTHSEHTDAQGNKYTEHACASAVVIRPHWVLTAAHVFSDAERATVRTEDGTKFPLVKLIPHKDYKPESVGWHDIALGRTAAPIELEFYPKLYTKTDELNQACTFAGWGLAGTFHTGGTHSDNKRRAGHNKIDSLSDAVLLCTPSRGAERFPLEFMITPGDSGGGMFLGNELAGINSFLLASDGKPNGTYTDETAFTRVSLYADWVESQIEKYELALQARATEGAQLE
jgi:hypothetical protein